jgi:hypothetical protein
VEHVNRRVPEICIRKNLLVDIYLELLKPDVQALNGVHDLEEQHIDRPAIVKSHCGIRRFLCLRCRRELVGGGPPLALVPLEEGEEGWRRPPDPPLVVCSERGRGRRT